MSQILAHKIAAAQTRYRAVALGMGLGRATACFCAAGLIVTALLDWRLDLPRPMRVLLLLLNLAVALYFLVRRGILPATRGVDVESVALAVEQMERRFGTRLIAAVQLGRPGALAAGESHAVVATMIRQTEAAAMDVDFRRAIKVIDLRRAAGAVALALILGSILFVAGGEHSRPLLVRALGAAEPWPSRTRVEVTRGSFLVAIGDSAILQARAIGYRPDSGSAQITYASGRRQSLTLSRISDDAYAGTLEDVAEPFTYRVTLYDGSSASFAVDAQPRPVVTSLTCTQVYPAYTGLGSVRREPADLLLLAGSRLRLRMTVNRPLQPLAPAEQDGSRIVFEGRTAGTTTGPAILSLTLQPDPEDSRTWTADFEPSADMSGFSIHLVDRLGLQSRNDPVYPLRLTADGAPTIRMSHPEVRQSLATADATCALAFTAEDDFGLAGLALHYRMDDGPETIVPLTLPAASKEAREDYAWRLSTLTPRAGHPSIEGSLIDFYIEVRDNNPAGPGIAASEHYQVRIVSKADKQAELIARMAASFAGIQELSDQQSKATAELRALSVEPPANSQPQTRPGP